MWPKEEVAPRQYSLRPNRKRATQKKDLQESPKTPTPAAKRVPRAGRTGKRANSTTPPTSSPATVGDAASLPSTPTSVGAVGAVSATATLVPAHSVGPGATRTTPSSLPVIVAPTTTVSPQTPPNAAFSNPRITRSAVVSTFRLPKATLSTTNTNPPLLPAQESRGLPPFIRAIPIQPNTILPGVRMTTLQPQSKKRKATQTLLAFAPAKRVKAETNKDYSPNILAVLSKFENFPLSPAEPIPSSVLFKQEMDSMR